MPLPDNAMDRLKAAFVSTDSAQGDGAPALRLSATGTQTFSSITLSATNAITFTAASAEIIPGATSLMFRNNADNATNLSITDAGAVTIRAGLTVTAGGATITAGNLGVGAAAAANKGVYVSGTTLSGNVNQYGMQIDATYSSAATTAGYGVYAFVTTQAAAFTMGSAIAFFAGVPVKGGGSTITTGTGLHVQSQTQGGTNNYGVYIEAPSGGATANIGLYNAGTTTLVGNTDLGTAGATLGVLKFNGNTSGTITVQSAAAAGTWTWTLPPDDGDAGEQLQTNGSGVTTWEAAASMRAFKNVLGRLNPTEGLKRILAAPVYEFTYKTEMEDGSRPRGTGDHKTVYSGVMADEAPWAMHHEGKIFSPVSAFGHAALAIQALQQQIDDLKRQMAISPA